MVRHQSFLCVLINAVNAGAKFITTRIRWRVKRNVLPPTKHAVIKLLLLCHPPDESLVPMRFTVTDKKRTIIPQKRREAAPVGNHAGRQPSIATITSASDHLVPFRTSIIRIA